jgi:hypothetical protein
MQGQLLHGAKVGRRFRPVNGPTPVATQLIAKAPPGAGAFAWQRAGHVRKMPSTPLSAEGAAGMANVEIVKVDQGGANARILAREAKVDFRRVEAASLKIATRFSSAEGKRMFVRMFNTLQLNMHFISVIARTRLDHEDIGRIETALRGRIDAATASLNEAIDGAEALFKAHGITSLASYDTVPLDVDVRVLSSISRRFLEVLVKLDQLMPLLQTLEIHEVVSAQAVDTQRAGLKRQVRDIANGARSFATGLRRRMNALDARATSPHDADGPGDANGAEVSEAIDALSAAARGEGTAPPTTELAAQAEAEPALVAAGTH